MKHVDVLVISSSQLLFVSQRLVFSAGKKRLQFQANTRTARVLFSLLIEIDFLSN